MLLEQLLYSRHLSHYIQFTFHMMNFRTYLITTLIFLAGCAGPEVRPIVDLKGKDKDQFEIDLKDCQNYALNEKGALETGAKNAAGGGIIGGALGLVLGGNKTSIAQLAGAGAVIGAGTGAYSGNKQQENIVKNCLKGRGYKVLN